MDVPYVCKYYSSYSSKKGFYLSSVFPVLQDYKGVRFNDQLESGQAKFRKQQSQQEKQIFNQNVDVLVPLLLLVCS